MPLFSYRAFDKNGVCIKGKIEKDDAKQVLEHLKSSGLSVAEVKELNFFNTDIGDLHAFKSKPSFAELSLMCRQMSFILESGLSMNTAFELLINNAPGKRLKKIFSEMNVDILKGESLHSSFSKAGIFPNFIVSMLKVGEQSGRLGHVTGRLAEYYEKEAKTEAEIKNAMLYPAIVGMMMILVVVIAIIYIVPSYSQMFFAAGMEMPLPTKILIGASEFIIRYVWFILLMFAAIAVGFIFLINSEKGKYASDWLRLNVFLIGKINVKNINLCFSQSMSILLDAGVETILALEIARDVIGNSVVTVYMDALIDEMRKGSSISKQMRGIKLFDPMLVSMVVIGEETGELPETLHKCAYYIQSETDTLVARTKELIGPFTTIVLGLILAFIMFAIMLPSFQISNIL